MNQDQATKFFDHEEVVCAFDQLGYAATFRQVASKMGIDPRRLTCDYPSREALGEFWLGSTMPKQPDADAMSLYGAFTGLLLPVLRQMSDYRDFSRDWLAAVTSASPLHLCELTRLRDAAGEYFFAWLTANAGSISLPPGLALDDICTELSDGLCTMSLLVIGHWATDRSPDSVESSNVADALGYLLDVLLMRRSDLGGSSALVHLVRVGRPLHSRLLEPLLDLVAKPDRVSRLLDPASLVEFVRTMRPAQAARR